MTTVNESSPKKGNEINENWELPVTEGPDSKDSIGYRMVSAVGKKNLIGLAVLLVLCAGFLIPTKSAHNENAASLALARDELKSLSEWAKTPKSSLEMTTKAATQRDALDHLVEIQAFKNEPEPQPHVQRRRARKKLANKAKEEEKWPGPQLITRPRDVRIPPGVQTEAVLTTLGKQGFVRASVTKALRHNSEVLIPLQSTLIGSAGGREGRLNLNFTQVVFPDGELMRISAVAMDPKDKEVGLEAKTTARRVLQVAGSIGLNFLTGFSEGLREKEVHGEVVVDKANMKNALLAGTQAAAFEEGKRVSNDLKNTPATLKAPPGTRFLVIFTGGSN